jgi:prevent-host-death family protein
MNSTNTLSISRLRQDTALAIETVVASKQPTIILQRSKPKAILVDYDYYNSLEESVLDLLDFKEAQKAKKEKRESFENYYHKRWGKKSA